MLEIINSIMLERCSFCVIPAVRCKIHVISKPQNCLCQKLCSFNAIQLESMKCEEKEKPCRFLSSFFISRNPARYIIAKTIHLFSVSRPGKIFWKVPRKYRQSIEEDYHDLHHGWCED